MKKWFLSVLLVFTFVWGLLGQSLLKVGMNIGTNFLIGDSPITHSQFAKNFGLFGLYQFSEKLGFQIQVGTGQFTVQYPQEKYITSFIPLEINTLLWPVEGKKFSPFFKFGIGILAFSLNKSPRYYDGILLGGAGLSFQVTQRFSWIASADLHYTSGDDFNGITNGVKDGYLSFQTGLVYALGTGEKKRERRDLFRESQIIAQGVAPHQMNNSNARTTTYASPRPENPPALEKKNPPVKEKAALNFANINFAFDCAELSHSARKILLGIIPLLKKNSKTILEIHGHTDSIGTHSYNQKLSEQRANAVKKFLVRHGISAERLITRGFGEDFPVASNGTKKGREMNRRVEFIYLNHFPSRITENKN